MHKKKTKAVWIMACALSVLPALAMAQGHDGGGQGPGGGDHGGHGGAPAPMHGGGPEHGSPRGGPVGGPGPMHGGPGAESFHGGPPMGRPMPMGGPSWRHNGGRLPDEYWRGNTYLVPDWSRYHLRRPPPGYQWRRVNGDYVLVAISTGLILQIIYGAHY